MESTSLPGVSIFFKPLNNSIVIVRYIPGFFLPNGSFKGMVKLLKALKIDTRLTPICRVVDSPTQRYAESSTLRICDTRSQRLSDSTIRRVGDSPYHCCGESTTLRIIDTESFLWKNSIASVSVMQGVADSAYQWCGESATLRISDAGSWWLPVSLIRGVGDSP